MDDFDRLQISDEGRKKDGPASRGTSFSRAHQQGATFAHVWYLPDGQMQPPGKLAAVASGLWRCINLWLRWWCHNKRKARCSLETNRNMRSTLLTYCLRRWIWTNTSCSTSPGGSSGNCTTSYLWHATTKPSQNYEAESHPSPDFPQIKTYQKMVIRV